MLILVVNLLVNFLKNTLNVVGLKGNSLALRSLVSTRRFMPNDGPGIITAIFGVTQDFSYAKVDTRLEVYKLIYTLLTKHREPIRQMGTEFMTGFSELAAIEKDPRCLMMMFSIVEVFLVEWEPAEVAAQTELVWELLIKYFPIRFKPKAGETVQITRADLNGRLGDCLKATSEMAQYVFPRVFESLDNSQLEADVKVSRTILSQGLVLIYHRLTLLR
jgi:DNA repair/transcription protein MET18/MMS19